MNPGQIFKCEVNGRITFSEQPCNAVQAEKKLDKVEKLDKAERVEPPMAPPKAR